MSPHVKTPRDPKTFGTEIKAANARLDQIDSLGATEKHFIEGNHEYWLERFINERAPELEGMLSIEKELRLSERGWTFTPYKHHIEVGKMNLTHECGNAGALAHIKAMEIFQGNVGIGHTHRLAVSYSGSAKGKSHVGFMSGWLGDINEVDYMHRIQALRGWHLGFSVGYLEPNGTMHVQPVPIIDYKLVLEGRIFRG